MGDSDKDERAHARAPLLSVEGLGIELRGRSGAVRIVEAIGFEIEAGETLGLTGPSGAGKTALALALMGLAPGDAAATFEGSIRLDGRELTGLDRKEWSGVRGREIGLIPQDPGSSLTPVRRVGDLVAEVMAANGGGNEPSDPTTLLAEVGFDDPDRIATLRPHELSGGMRRRVAIAAALAGEPRLLIADEPTSSLDVVAGRRIMELLASIQRRRSMAMLLIGHDRRALARDSDRVLELEGGRLRPMRPAPSSSPRSAVAPAALSEGSAAPLRIEDLEVTFEGGGSRAGVVQAVRGVSLRVGSGESVGLVGPTGSGKTTLARCVVRLLEPTAGTVSVDDPRGIGMVFQDPAGSFNPTRRLGSAIEAPLRVRNSIGPADRRRLLSGAVESVRLDPGLLRRYPGELSGGQLQRGALARALVTAPGLLILDEPFTALDAEAETELVDLLLRLRRERGLALLLITHDLRLVSRLAERVAVMDGGRIIESGPTARLLAEPRSALTRELVSAAFPD